MHREVVIGGTAGMAWACGLRAWMATLVGAESSLTLRGTVVGLVGPAALVGGALGSAVVRRRRGDQRFRAALIASPLLLAAAPLTLPGAIGQLTATGQGSGAIGMVSVAMIGAVGVSGRGAWRIPAGVLGLAPAVAIWLAPPMRPELDRSTALGAVSAASFSLLYLALVCACALPMRQPIQRSDD